MYISKKKHTYSEMTPTEPTADVTPTEVTVSTIETVSAVDAAPTIVTEQVPVLEKAPMELKEDIEVPKNPQVLDTEGEQDQKAERYAEFENENRDVGALKIQASSGNASIPLVNVNILVYKDFTDGRHIFYSGATNADGMINAIALPAPPKINSELGNGLSPYASYSVLASREGLIDEKVENVPIFSGVKSIQPIVMSSVGEV